MLWKISFHCFNHVRLEFSNKISSLSQNAHKFRHTCSKQNWPFNLKAPGCIILIRFFFSGIEWKYIWEVSPRVRNDPYRLVFFCSAVKPVNWWISCQTFCNLSCMSIHTNVWFSSFLFNSLNCWSWLNQSLNLAFKYFWLLKFGLSLCAILTYLEIWRGVCANLFQKPLAFTF